MYKVLFAVFFALLCGVRAGYLGTPSAVVYATPSEYPSASGYEYQHTVQTPDYVNHASVVKPLNGFVNAPQLVRTVYNGAPGAYPYHYAPYASAAW